MVFPVVMCRYESSTIKKAECFQISNWFLQIVVLENTFESSKDWKAIKPFNLKGNQAWILIGRMDAEAEGPKLWLPDVKRWLIGKDPEVGEDWGQEEKGMTEDERVGWHHWLNGHELEQTLGDGEGQGSLAYYSPRGRKESDTTEGLNNS